MLSVEHFRISGRGGVWIAVLWEEKIQGGITFSLKGGKGSKTTWKGSRASCGGGGLAWI